MTNLKLKLVLVSAFASLSTQALALEKPPAALESAMKKSACLACHAIDKKQVGPSFNDISAKYKDKAGSRDYLAAKIRKGSEGKMVWGAVPMPAQAAISDQEIQSVLDWLEVKK